MRVPLALLLCLVLAGCGDAGGGGSNLALDEPDEQLPVVTVDGAVQLSCGDLGFPASAMEGGVPDLADHDEVVDVLERLAGVAPMDAPEQLRDGDGVQDADWILLARGDSRGEDQLVVGVGEWGLEGPQDRAMSVRLEWRNGEWDPSGWGGCNLAPVLEPGNTWVGVTAPSEGLERTSTTFEVGVNEKTCTGSRDPSDYLHDPAIVEENDSVTVYWTSTPPEGAQSCPGNPTVNQTIELDEPLGDRDLLDGSTYPPTPVVARG